MKNFSTTLVVRSVVLIMALSRFPASPLMAQEATITEQYQTFRTYPFGDPDPVARMGNIYPYFRFQGYSFTPVSRDWKVVTLENKYIRVLIAPEIGGKILGAFEKSTGRAFIYYNRVVKFREIAMRGAWTSGGIEFNFGDIGHTPTTATPVDYATRKNPDGSVSCFVGALDLASRTEWRVEIRLPRDKAYFETRSFWYNPTDVSTSRYHWMNAAAEADSDLQFIYPGNAFIGHGGEPSSWPVDFKGRDLSLYRNNAFGSYKSYHVLGVATDFFGGRWIQPDFGVLHWSRYADKPGKKLWIWGLSREGDIWKDLLTDADLGNDQYVELQSGLHFNQAASPSSMTPFKHMVFPSCGDERFVEAWFPFKGIGGVRQANTHGVLNASQVGGKLIIGLCPLETINDELTVTIASQKVYTKHLALLPLQPFVDSISLGEGQQEIRVRVGNLLEYSSDDDSAAILSRPISTAENFDWTSAFGLSTSARERERQRDFDGALDTYRASLNREPLYIPALAGMAELFYRRMEYDSALVYATKILRLDTYDPDANYIYGLVQRRHKRYRNAEDAFGIVARSNEFRSAANVQLAEVAFVQHRYDDAEEFARRAIDYDRYNVRAEELLSLASRRRGDTVAADQMLASIASGDPLNHFVRCEAFLRAPTEANGRALTSMIRNELPHETYLELASYYLRLDRPGDAAKILDLAPPHAMVDYWRAYLMYLAGDAGGSRKALDQAQRDAATLVFPHRAESEDVLLWAEKEAPHWKTKYYLALLYWSKGRHEEARKYFSACGNTPDYYPFYLARASFMNDSEKSAADYRRGIELAPAEWRGYATYIEFCSQRGRFGEALDVSRKAFARFPANYMLGFAHARTLLFHGDAAASLAILDTLSILPFEGARYGRDAFRQACVLTAIEKIGKREYRGAAGLLAHAREWPERLGAGRPYEVDNRLEDYLEAAVNESLHAQDQAKANLASIVSYSTAHPDNGGVQQLFYALALRRLGKGEEAQRFLDSWQKRDPSNPVVIWSMLKYNGENDRAHKLEETLRSGVLQRATGDQEFVLVVDVMNALKPE